MGSDLASAVLAQFDADWYAANVEPLVFSDKDSQESLHEKGHELLQLYVEQTNGKRPVAVEQEFELELVDPETGELLGLRLRGFIDLVEDDETLVDLKTVARTPQAGDLERHLQLSIYALVYSPAARPDPQAPAGPALEDQGWPARAADDVEVRRGPGSRRRRVSSRVPGPP